MGLRANHSMPLTPSGTADVTDLWVAIPLTSDGAE
jgi:hypothetical protein